MKKIILLGLWVKGVYLQNKRFGKAYINQKWGSCEGGLQKVDPSESDE